MKFSRAIKLYILVEVCIIFMAWMLEQETITVWQTTSRFSGRLSLLAFSFIFLFHHTPRRLHALLSSKPYHVFALIHSIHLVELLVYQYLIGGKANLARVAGGVIAYLIILIIPFITLLYEKHRLTVKQYSFFKYIFLYYVWIAFFITYLPRVKGTARVGGNYWEFIVLMTWVCLILIIHIFNSISFMRKTAIEKKMRASLI